MGRRREILCIDDDVQSLNVRRILLESMGYQVWTELDAQHGLRSFQDHSIDAVVMDYEMPGMNGGEAAAAMKAIRPEVPVLILSALPWLPEGAPQESIDGFIHKGEPLKYERIRCFSVSLNSTIFWFAVWSVTVSPWKR